MCQVSLRTNENGMVTHPLYLALAYPGLSTKTRQDMSKNVKKIFLIGLIY